MFYFRMIFCQRIYILDAMKSGGEKSACLVWATTYNAL